MRPTTHGPGPKVEVYHYRGWHSHALDPRCAAICGQPQTLLDDGPGSVVLQVEQVQHVLSHLSHTSVEVGALRVRHGHNVLLPRGVLLITNRKEHGRYLGEAALTQGGEGDECHLLDSAVELTAYDGPHPWDHWVERYHQADLPHNQAMGPGQTAAVERVVPIVAKMMECVIQHSWKPRAVLYHGSRSPVLSEGEVVVVVHVHLKTQP
jgi:hypothetical protein